MPSDTESIKSLESLDYHAILDAVPDSQTDDLLKRFETLLRQIYNYQFEEALVSLSQLRSRRKANGG